MKPGDVYSIHIPKEQREGREFFGAHLHVVVSPPYMLGGDLVMLVPLTSAVPADRYREFRIRIPAIELGAKGRDANGNAVVDGFALTDQLFAACKSRIDEHECYVSTLTPATLAGIRRGIEFTVGIPRLGPSSGPRPLAPPLKRT